MANKIYKEGDRVNVNQWLEGVPPLYGIVKKMYGVWVIEIDKNLYCSLCLNVEAHKHLKSSESNFTGWIVSYDGGRENTNTIQYKNEALRLLDEISEKKYNRKQKEYEPINNKEIVVEFRKF